ncbi:MAG: PepSY domain-containing protein [Coriobacteriia bacterium]|nr:PepSY domain-containing protein [Coriobacteriia bacterium]
MLNKKMFAMMAAAALAACLALAGCGGTQSAPSSSSAPAESSSAASAATSESTASAAAPESTAAKTEEATIDRETTGDDPYIGDQQAIEIALKDAGFAQADVTELEIELDADDAVPHYDIGFKQSGMEYDYDVDAATGDIMSSESEVDD